MPHLGDSRVPDVLVAQLAKILQHGSKIYDTEEVPGFSPSSSTSSISTPSSAPTTPASSTSHKVHSAAPSRAKKSSPLSSTSAGALSKVAVVDIDTQYSDLGSSDHGSLLPRERFSYWCFDLLFLICSDVTRGGFRLAPTHPKSDS